MSDDLGSESIHTFSLFWTELFNDLTQNKPSFNIIDWEEEKKNSLKSSFIF